MIDQESTVIRPQQFRQAHELRFSGSTAAVPDRSQLLAALVIWSGGRNDNGRYLRNVSGATVTQENGRRNRDHQATDFGFIMLQPES